MPTDELNEFVRRVARRRQHRVRARQRGPAIRLLRTPSSWRSGQPRPGARTDRHAPWPTPARAPDREWGVWWRCPRQLRSRFQARAAGYYGLERLGRMFAHRDCSTRAFRGRLLGLPVRALRVLLAMQSCVTGAADGTELGANQRSSAEALALYTTAPPTPPARRATRAAGGGMLADFTVLDRDPLTTHPRAGRIASPRPGSARRPYTGREWRWWLCITHFDYLLATRTPCSRELVVRTRLPVFFMDVQPVSSAAGRAGHGISDATADAVSGCPLHLCICSAFAIAHGSADDLWTSNRRLA